jgi:glycine dehydrogenase
MYAIYHGPQGLKDIAKRVNLAAYIAQKTFEHYGFTVLETKNFFDTITIVDCNA